MGAQHESSTSNAQHESSTEASQEMRALRMALEDASEMNAKLALEHSKLRLERDVAVKTLQKTGSQCMEWVVSAPAGLNHGQRFAVADIWLKNVQDCASVVSGLNSFCDGLSWAHAAWADIARQQEPNVGEQLNTRSNLSPAPVKGGGQAAERAVLPREAASEATSTARSPVSSSRAPIVPELVPDGEATITTLKALAAMMAAQSHIGGGGRALQHQTASPGDTFQQLLVLPEVIASAQRPAAQARRETVDHMAAAADLTLRDLGDIGADVALRRLAEKRTESRKKAKMAPPPLDAERGVSQVASLQSVRSSYSSTASAAQSSLYSSQQ